jgi:hypothetical protein
MPVNKRMSVVAAMPLWVAWLIHAYWLGVVDTRRRAVLIGVACWLTGMGLGVLAGGGL